MLGLKLKFYPELGSNSTAVSALRPPFSDRWLLRERNMGDREGERERKRARFHLVAAVSPPLSLRYPLPNTDDASVLGKKLTCGKKRERRRSCIELPSFSREEVDLQSVLFVGDN